MGLQRVGQDLVTKLPITFLSCNSEIMINNEYNRNGKISKKFTKEARAYKGPRGSFSRRPLLYTNLASQSTELFWTSTCQTVLNYLGNRDELETCSQIWKSFYSSKENEPIKRQPWCRVGRAMLGRVGAEGGRRGAKDPVRRTSGVAFECQEMRGILSVKNQVLRFK